MFQNNRLLIFGIGLGTFILSLTVIIWSVKPGTSGEVVFQSILPYYD